MVEPFFGDNKEEARAAVEYKQELAEAIVKGFERWKSLIAYERGLVATPDTPNTPDTPDTPDTPSTRTSKKRSSRRTK